MIGELMSVDLVGTVDSLHGTWRIGNAEGPIRGARAMALLCLALVFIG